MYDMCVICGERPATRAAGRCRRCERDLYRATHPEKFAEEKRRERKRWRTANVEKRRAQKAVQKAVARGTLIRPEACSRCGATGLIEGHHADYSRRLDVKWLCQPCHQKEHSA